MTVIKVQASERKKCDVRLSSTDQALDDTESQGYKTLYPQCSFFALQGISVVWGGLGGTLMQEYITDRSSKAEETLVLKQVFPPQSGGKQRQRRFSRAYGQTHPKVRGLGNLAA